MSHIVQYLSAFRNVERNADISAHRSRVCRHRPHGQIDRRPRPITPDQRPLLLPLLARRHTGRQNVKPNLIQRRRRIPTQRPSQQLPLIMEHRQGSLPHQLLTAVTGQLLRRHIHRCNQSMRVGGNNAEGSVLKHRIRKLRKLGVSFLSRLRLADIAKGNRQSISQLHHLAPQPRCLDAFILHGKLFI